MGEGGRLEINDEIGSRDFTDCNANDATPLCCQVITLVSLFTFCVRNRMC